MADVLSRAATGSGHQGVSAGVAPRRGCGQAACSFVAALVLLGGAAAQAGTLIDTRPSAKSAIGYFGEPDTTTYGQTFTAPSSDTRLDSFTFFLRPASGVARFRAYVYAWNEDLGQVEGDALFSSATRRLAAGQGDTFERVTIRTQGVELSPTGSYVAFFSAAGLFDRQGDRSEWQSTRADVYQGGHFVFHNSSGRFPGPQTRWSCGQGCAWEVPGGDLAFQMTFNMAAVPEPSSVAMALAGLGLVGWTTRRAKARRTS